MTGDDEGPLTLEQIMANVPHRPDVEIRVTVTLPDGRKVEAVRREPESLWHGYYSYYQTKLIRDTAEHVAARIAYSAERRSDPFES